jgi:chloramphenicol-sensitive protein RarD
MPSGFGRTGCRGSGNLAAVTENSNCATAPSPTETRAPQSQARAGLLYALSAYTMWGFIPIYFHALAEVSPMVILCHRVVWSAVFLGLVISLRGEWGSLRPVVSTGRNRLLLVAGSILIALNWLIFIYAVTSGQLLQASLGYFINPLLSIALGMVFLGERLRAWQWLAVAIALIAVANLALRGSGFPWIAVSLACSFGFYGLVRKTVNVNSLHGLLIETAILLPAAAVTLALLPLRGASLGIWGLLSLAGVITAVPLLCFGAALRRLQLSTMGFLQYAGPILQFLVALCLFREPLDRAKFASFGLCWLAIAVYVADSLLNRRPQPIADEPD